MHYSYTNTNVLNAQKHSHVLTPNKHLDELHGFWLRALLQHANLHFVA